MTGCDKFNIVIRPNLLPAFTEAGKVNCTYTLRVPKTIYATAGETLDLQGVVSVGQREYTQDDSDVVAAAMHSGFIKAVAPEKRGTKYSWIEW